MLRALSVFLLASSIAAAQTPDTVFLEEMTWTEVRDAIHAGKTTVILPTGGTEQNGPHMVLGKHNIIVKYAAERIAHRLGNALVAPVLAYVPEGDPAHPAGHLLFPGTITLPGAYFQKVTEYAARSFRQAGFHDIVFIGDHGSSQAPLKAAAAALNQEWKGTAVRAHFISDYYSNAAATEWLKKQGEKEQDIGTHAGILDTSQLMAIDPAGIRSDQVTRGTGFRGDGVIGDPTRARAAYGKYMLDQKVDLAVAQIQKLMARPRAR